MTTEFEKLYNAAELGKVLDVSDRTAYRLLKTGVVRSVVIGSSYRAPHSAIEEFLQGTHDAKNAKPRRPAKR